MVIVGTQADANRCSSHLPERLNTGEISQQYTVTGVRIKSLEEMNFNSIVVQHLLLPEAPSTQNFRAISSVTHDELTKPGLHSSACSCAYDN